ncbi:aspartyl-phosphate phosphatase Spo0E family protein [Paramaledivibacter caminithermalis]|jgi:hypothetical protein|uniref:Spo0E like sporulation regulatory protein n=1 Tax=Paramaledivibacter caminithermalis (strain DSM 15212 / CIP 107654 / DViRD3) TaxID=1121301 RepID=A0A1M6LHU7_PARC5|nr:aspartyl-phosphate phosphatase Spo0E family protein [Paramaledivibacter caminithermalis]SHJ70761.1 Spo0E like sporulation regulatory protein [Paramaledivibacter caminithermalis DSM 15212]
MKEVKFDDKQDINNRINELRFKLNEIYKTQGHTKEVVKLSQELDKYIFSIQRQILEKQKKDKD